MPFAVVLDTCVLYPAHLRDTLLRLAERGLYRVLWSADIVDELRHNLVESGFDPVSINQLIVEMGKAFPDAEVVGYHALIDGLECDSKDRHVLAAAVRAGASSIVTFKIDDFPAGSVLPFEVEVSTPDTFLLDLLDLAPATVIDELSRQAQANRRDPKTLPSILDALCKAGVPSFADEVRRRTA